MKAPVGLGAIIGSAMCLIGLSFATPPAPAMVEQGRVIYEQRCLDCHGHEGRGDGTRAISLSPRPGNLVSAHTSAKSDQELMKIISNGRPRTAMSAYKGHLSEDQQQAVLAYIRSLVKFTGSTSPPPPAQ